MNPLVQKKEQRRYPRRHRAFPVKFQFLDENGQAYGEIYDAVTRNVAKGGMLIEARVERKKPWPGLVPDTTKLKLIIRIPADSAPIDSVVTARWQAKVPEPLFDVYFFGVEYVKIDNDQQIMIERYIKRLRQRPLFIFYFLLLFTAFFIVFAYTILVAH